MDLFGEEEEQAEVGKYMFAGVEEEEESATEKEKARPNAVKDEVANGSLFFPERRKQAGRQRTGWAERRAAAEDGVPSLLIQCLDVVALHLDMRNNSNSQMTKRDLEWLPLELKERLVSHLIKYHKLTDENFMACVPSGVGALDLTEALGLTRKSIEAVANTCPRLHTLNLTYCWDISTELMPHLPRLFSNLASLVLDKLTLEPDIVHSLLTNGEQLRSLSLRETETSFSLRAITGLTRLESLTITHEQVTATSDDVAPFNTFLERNTSLRHLNLYMAFHPQKRISYRTSHDDDEYYAGLNFHLATGLLSLDLSHHPILTQQLQEICGQCTDLVSLSLEGCKRYELNFSSISECKQLRWLNLRKTNVSDGQLLSIGKGCPHLQYLDIAHTLVTAAAFHYYNQYGFDFSAPAEVILAFGNLQELNASWTPLSNYTQPGPVLPRYGLPTSSSPTTYVTALRFGLMDCLPWLPECLERLTLSLPQALLPKLRAAHPRLSALTILME